MADDTAIYAVQYHQRFRNAISSLYWYWYDYKSTYPLSRNCDNLLSFFGRGQFYEILKCCPPMKTRDERSCCIATLLFLVLFRPILAGAWRQNDPGLSLRPPITFQNPGKPFSTVLRNFRPGQLKSSSTSDDIEPPDVNKKRLIEVESEVELPFSCEVAFDAYSDLRRQPSWSSWLHSVEYTDDSKESSLWTMKFMGIKHSWTAVAVRNERPHTIQWQSTSGLQNFGTVKFLPTHNPENPTLMTMRMTFVAPRAAASVFRRSKAMANFVRTRMILDSMLNFRDTIVEDDLKET